MYNASFCMGDVQIKVNADNLSFSGVCEICGQEVSLDDNIEKLPSDYDFYNHLYICDECYEAVKPYVVPIEGESYIIYDRFAMIVNADIKSDLFTWALYNASENELQSAWESISDPDSKPEIFAERLNAIDTELERRNKQEVHK